MQKAPKHHSSIRWTQLLHWDETVWFFIER